MERVDVFVIGGGGAGSDVTSALATAGLSVIMAERDRLGGECANFGCDPTKAMLKSARVASLARRGSEFGIRIPSVEVDFAAVVERARRLIEEQTAGGAKHYEDLGARVLMQEARLVDEHRIELADGTVFEADRVVLTTGTEPSPPPIPGLDAGGYWTSKEALWHGGALPSSLLILGAGAIGVEFGQMYARFGSRVTLVEGAGRVLPLEDADASAALAQSLGAEGIQIYANANATGVERVGGGGWRLMLDDGRALQAEKLLVATGRKPCFEVHDLAAARVDLDDRGWPVLGDTLRTTASHIWAGGDATGELLFTHVGGYEAEVIVADILGRPIKRDYRVVPRVTFSEPEVASVGLTEEQAVEAGGQVISSVIPFAGNARAFIEGERAGLVKLVADAKTGELLGAHIVGEASGELIHVVVAVMAGHVGLRAMGDAIHAYPTRAESLRAAFRDLAAQLRSGGQFE